MRKKRPWQNNPLASLDLQRQMKKKTWPKTLDSLHYFPPRERLPVFAKSPFHDPKDGLIKVGGLITKSDLSFFRKHPTMIPDTLLGDALIWYLHGSSHHKDRKITSAAIREERLFPVGGRKGIDCVISVLAGPERTIGPL